MIFVCFFDISRRTQNGLSKEACAKCQNLNVSDRGMVLSSTFHFRNLQNSKELCIGDELDNTTKNLKKHLVIVPFAKIESMEPVKLIHYTVDSKKVDRHQNLVPNNPDVTLGWVLIQVH